MPLFDPLRVGDLTLPNRVVMAPLGRARGDAEARAPNALVARYYAQRASAGLIISEATHISAETVSRPGTTAIHTEAQVAAWRGVTDAVHAAGGRIFQQLFHLGRKADPARMLAGDWPRAPSGVAAVGQYKTLEGALPFPTPRVLADTEIPDLVAAFAAAAANSRRAGFDGVEIHGANGFLVDQFLRDSANRREDGYGLNAVGRTRFLLEVFDAIADVLGPERVGVRLSPHPMADGTSDSAPDRYLAQAASALSARGAAYLHVIEPASTPPDARLAPVVRARFEGPLILCGKFDKASATEALDEGRADLIAFGAGFIANPDLVERLRRDAPWNPPRIETFYDGGAEGFTDYPVLAPIPA